MRYLPRQEILNQLELAIGHKLVDPTAIHDQDLQDVWDVIESIRDQLDYFYEDSPESVER